MINRLLIIYFLGFFLCFVSLNVILIHRIVLDEDGALVAQAFPLRTFIWTNKTSEPPRAFALDHVQGPVKDPLRGLHWSLTSNFCAPPMAVLGDGPDTTTFLVSFVIHVKYYKLVFMFQKLLYIYKKNNKVMFA